MHEARATLRAVADSLHLVAAGDRPRVEGRLTPRSGDRGTAAEVVVTFFAADGREVGTASAPVQPARGENAARFSVPAPAGPAAAAGYRYTIRYP